MAKDYSKSNNHEHRDPSSHRTPSQIHKMDRGYNATDRVQGHRVLNNAARRMMEHEGKVHVGDHQDVDHKHPLRKGGGNSRKNLRVISASRNRGWADGKV
jgi:5-methylcytosine-specific restriction endonuclease McrA